MSTKEDDSNSVVSSYVTSNGTAAGLDGAKITLSIPKSELGKTYYLFAEKDAAVIEIAGGALTVGTRSAAIDVTGSVDVVSDLKSLEIDTVIPTNTVSSVEYDPYNGVITITGDGFDSLDVLDAADVKNQLDLTKLVWDIDGDAATTSGVTFSNEDFATIIKTDNTTLTATLSAGGKTKLNPQPVLLQMELEILQAKQTTWT